MYEISSSEWTCCTNLGSPTTCELNEVLNKFSVQNNGVWLGERDAWQGKLYLPPNVSRTNGEISAFASGKHPSFSLMQLSTRSLNTCRWRWVLTIYCSSERSLKCSRKLFFCTFNLAELLWCETQLIMNVQCAHKLGLLLPGEYSVSNGESKYAVEAGFVHIVRTVQNNLRGRQIGTVIIIVC